MDVVSQTAKSLVNKVLSLVASNPLCVFHYIAAYRPKLSIILHLSVKLISFTALLSTGMTLERYLPLIRAVRERGGEQRTMEVGRRWTYL